MTGTAVRRDGQPAGLELVVFLSDRAGTASRAFQALKAQAREGGPAILNAAVLIRDQGGETFAFETGPADPTYGASFGTITGALLGLMSGTVGSDLGRAAAVGTCIDFDDDYSAMLQASFPPGSSALAILVETERVERVNRILGEFSGQLAQQTLAYDLLAQCAAETETDR